MPMYIVEYTKTERTRQRTMIQADTEAEAVALVEEYEHDNSDDWQVDSLEYSIADVTLAEEMA